MVTAGGLVMGSNLGFKINKNIFAQFNAGQSPKRNNWVSLPYNHPYTTVTQLCTAIGAPTTGSIIKINPLTGATANSPGGCTVPTAGNTCGGTCTETGFSFSCGTTPTAIPDLNCISSAGLQIRETGGVVSHGAVLVGSSNETKSWPIIRGAFSAGGAPKGDNWVSVPYHSTWVNAQDVCTSLAVTSVHRINADPAAGAAVSNYTCGAGGAFSLVIGEGLLVRKTTAGDLTGFLPPHF
jgi:hypothetical protein